jgi:predicted kinase
MTQCILLGGAAGVGKSTLCSELEKNIIVLRKDELTARVTQTLLLAHGQPSHDRESAVYLEYVRPLEYHILIEYALACIYSGVNVVVEAPWILEMTDDDWVVNMTRRVQTAGGHLKFVWLTCEPMVNHQRILKRGAERDIGKLVNWDEYVQNSGRWIRHSPTSAHIVLDTTAMTPFQLAHALRHSLGLAIAEEDTL